MFDTIMFLTPLCFSASAVNPLRLITLALLTGALMMYQFPRFSVLFLGILINGCAYMDKRMADFKDIGTLAIETKGVNAEIQILPLTLGAGYANGKGYGLRSGTLGEYEYKEYGVAIIGRKIFKGTS